MVVYNKTNVDKDIMLNSLVKATKRTQLPRLVLSSIILACGIPFVIYGHIANQSDYLAMGYAFIAISVIYYWIAIMAINKAGKNVYEKNKDVVENGIVYNYQFKEQSFNVTVITGNKTNKLPYKYDAVKKIYEFEDRYEFRLKDNQVLFINKSGFESLKHVEFFLKNLSKNKKKIKNVQKQKKAQENS